MPTNYYTWSCPLVSRTSCFTDFCVCLLLLLLSSPESGTESTPKEVASERNFSWTLSREASTLSRYDTVVVLLIVIDRVDLVAVFLTRTAPSEVE